MMNAVESDKYLQDITRILKNYSKPLDSVKLEVLHKAILDNINNNLEFSVPPPAQKKWEQLLSNVKVNVTEITKDVVNNLKKKKISSLSKATDESLQRNLSQDRLSGYLEFKDDLKFNLRLNKRINTDLNSPINCLSNIDSNYVAVGAQDGSVSVYSVNNGQLVGGHKSHSDQVFTMGSFREKDNFYVVSTGYGADNRIIVWKLFTSSPFMQLSDGNSTTSCLTFHNEYKRNMVTGTLDNNICIWDLANGKLTRKIPAHKSQVSNIRYLPTIDMFASSGWDNMIKLWKIEYKIDEYDKLVNNLVIFQT